MSANDWRWMATVIGLVCVLGVGGWAWGQDGGGAGATQPTDGAADDDPSKTLPFIRIDREGDHIDLEATVVRGEPDWLELIACSPNSREHESIVTVPARPSHVHLALLLLGLEPGHPLTGRQVDGEWVADPPEGPPVAVFFVVEGEDGEPVEVPANEWAVHRPTGETMENNIWLFTGSQFRMVEGQRIYLADLNGTVISLVNFGDDLLARPTTLTNETDEQAWAIAADRVPPGGTDLIVRLRPVREEEG